MSRMRRLEWFRLQRSSRTKSSPRHDRHLRYEPLEDRRMLAAITVNSMADDLVVDGMVTLREAIQAANTDASVDGSVAGSGADIIEFDVALSGQTLLLNGTELTITTALTIDANALASNVTIDAQQNSRLFNIDDGVFNVSIQIDVTLSGLTLTGGRPDKSTGSISGGAIRSRENLLIENSTITDNTTVSGILGGNAGNGGAIHSSGTLTIVGSTISGNTTGNGSFSGVSGPGNGGNGGGIYSSGPLNIIASTIANNSTGRGNSRSTIPPHPAGEHGKGGGIAIRDTELNITCSTISGNTTASRGGGIWSNTSLEDPSMAIAIVNSTISENTTDYAGGGIWNDNDTFTITNSILTGNTAGNNSPDIRPGAGIFTVNFSLIGTEVTPDVGTSGNNVSTDFPLLGPLANNGGPTETHALLAGSPAIDAGNPGILFDPAEFDQRGAPFVRVFDGGVAGLRIDMGAAERQTLPALNLVVDTPVDENDGDYTTGDLSLREAVGLANGSVGADTIAVDAAVFATPQTILLSLGEVEVSEAVTIDGPGQQFLTIDAQQQTRIFNITATTGDFTLAGLTLTGGQTTGDNATFINTFSGAAVRSLTTGNLTIDQSTVSGNSTTGIGADGGGIFSSRAIILTSSTVSGNSTAGNNADGGGIFSSTVTLTSSTVSGNSTAGSFARGGGIRSGGTVTLTSSTVSGNSTTGNNADGGGISSSSGGVTLTSSTVSGNNTTGTNAEGGGISSYGAVVTLTSSTVSGNSTTGSSAFGGGIFSDAGFFFDSDVTLINSTLSGNSTTGSNAAGGGIFSEGTVTLTSSTVTDNQAHGSIGGGIRNFGGAVTITNSIVAGNTAGDGIDDINPGTGSFNVSFSLIGDNDGSGFTEAPVGSPDINGNLIGGSVNGIIDPLLDPLADNGGPTETHALLVGSPAINGGDPTIVFNPADFDQRGAPFVRVFDDPVATDSGVDMGAFEVQTIAASADFDSDGDVDGGDFLAWQRGHGIQMPNAMKVDGDADNDLDVDGADLSVWQLQYGTVPLLAAVEGLESENSSQLSAVNSEPILKSELVNLAQAMEWIDGGAGEEEVFALDEQSINEAAIDSLFASDYDLPVAHSASDNESLVSDSEDEDGSETWLSEGLLERVLGSAE